MAAVIVMAVLYLENHS
ncbi:TPA: hypothetical protein HIO14_RS12660 [Escherichia coli]